MIEISICIYKGQKAKLCFPVSSTVEDLKLEVHKHFNIRPSKQIISGWTAAPENDDSTLESCTVQGSILLVVNSEHNKEAEEIVTFSLVYDNVEKIVHLLNKDSVETLKREIHKLFELRPDEQVIDGWKRSPNSESTKLQECADGYITCLTISRRFNTYCNNVNVEGMDFIDGTEGTETEASWSFINKFLNKGGIYSEKFLPQSCKLEEAIRQSCLTQLNERKVLILYLHKDNDAFSSMFCDSLRKQDVLNILHRNVFFLGWDIDHPKYQSALRNALNECSNLLNISEMITFKFSLALCLVPINDSIVIFSCLKGDISYTDLLLTLKRAEDCLVTEKQEEKCLKQLKQKTGNADDFNSQKYQQLMADMLGDRDYDAFESDQSKQLKDKIAYALLGPPRSEDGYDSKDKKRIESIYTKVLAYSNEISGFRDTVEMSCIYNCTEPLPGEKLKRAKKFKDYNPNTDINPRPIFVLRKCRGSANPCRVFVDDVGRMYKSWRQYINCNKLHKCEMVLPRNGRYQFHDSGEVILERHLSPMCGTDIQTLQYVDYVSTAGGVFSGGMFAVATISSIAVAPAALVTAAAVGIGVGVYAIGRSAHSLYDRSRHRESMSFANSEARGAYLNIIAGSLGFVGAGATMAVSQLAARGVNVGRGVAAAVDGVALFNIGLGGASMLNSGYDVFDQWYNENQTPSLLTVIQLSSSVLFFGNAVYNFKTCTTIVQETQTKMLQDYQNSLRSNRHRKTFTKMMKETIRQNNGNEVQGRAEVISTIRNIPNKDEVFAVLTRSKKTMNRNGIKFAAVDGDIKLNGIKIDMNEFANMNQKDASAFLSNLSSTQATQAETVSMQKMVYNTFRGITLPDIATALQEVASFTLKLINSCSDNIKSKIITAVARLLEQITDALMEELNILFHGITKYHKIIEVTVRFFAKKAEDLEQQYEKWKRTGDDRYYHVLFSHINITNMKNKIVLFELIVESFFCGPEFRQNALRKLMGYFTNWLASALCEFQLMRDRDNKRRQNSATLCITTSQNQCSVCGGYYYTHGVQ